MDKRRIFAAAVAMMCGSIIGAAADWPQWRGPQRTGISTETGLLQLWCVARDGRRWKLEFNVREQVTQ